ncbi:SAF domain-containing protein [Corynebacterium liangguodongii]|uniref:Uncharacterized protein n=1 Tax=Corynebacterium liangguodongii TaxID=2079535 RepID=A0A2S0WD26_9CORY|nr:SAF domain-containing protein [Corynebacterium liangguodongii]AWB83673.1 hypothetical protein C3E79_03540 [Corynebacterium liangguodongii]PWB99517.1 hypothetical protein DF219_06255 [Corynebacterium liangguodongii]
MKTFPLQALQALQALRTPGYRRTVAVRRAAALALLTAAAVNLVSGRAADPQVVTFSRPVGAGSVVEAADLEVRRLPAEAVPDNAVREIDVAAGRILAAGASRGEVLTSTRLVGPDLARELAGGAPPEDYAMVPVALAEPEIIPLLHHGATVSVVTTGDEGAAPVTVATGGRVVVAEAEAGTVLLLLHDSQAAAVAAAALASPLAVVLNGQA